MNARTNAAPEGEEIELLLPWHAAGTLSRRDARRVEEALAGDPELARRFALVREELSGTIVFNETLGAPSARAMERLMAGIETESGPARQPTRTRVSFVSWLNEKMSSLSPRTLGYAATAATLAIVLQFGALTGVAVNSMLSDEGYETASYRSDTPGGAGSYALIGFLPNAGVNEMTAFLEKNDLTVVDGPRGGGLYRVRVAARVLPPDELERRLQQLRQESAVIRFIAPAQ